MADGTKTRWGRVEALFYRASEMDAAGRESFIAEECAGDLELRAELDSLLASSEMTLAGLAGSVADAAGNLLAAQQEKLTRVGAYRILRTLGEGGMGTVYLGARDDDQYDRTVAIKVLRAALTHRPELQLLFRSERQILADFDHPNIARMLDGGITPHGSPYLVMEYVDGMALDAYCESRKLSLDARLKLFRTLCTAVDYAHRHLVIHRDIKPLNVLVTVDGELKLLDFGIAKLIDPYRGPQENAPTEPPAFAMGEHMLTPDYASPEQLTGRAISTATDVYALGVLLFELLAGELPAGGSRNKRATSRGDETTRNPEKPSAVCLRTQHLPRSEARRMRGDLDSIILKALHEDPEQRYANASEMLADLDRYVSGFAVDAAEQGVAYRAKKFVRRHRAGVALTVLAVLAILGFASEMALLARRASRGEALARREEDFLAGIFKAATPEGSNGENITARQLLDQAAKRLDTELSADPELQAEMTESVGQSYVDVGLYTEAQPLLERALRLTAQSVGTTGASYATDLAHLATDYRLEGNYEKAEPLFVQAAALNERLYGSRSAQFAQSLSSLGECFYWEEKDGEAEQTLRRALVVERGLPMNKQGAARSYLALTIERRGAYAEAAELLREFADISAAVNGKQSNEYLIALHNLAGTQIDMGDLDGALKSDGEVLATRQKIWGPDHPDTAYSLNNLGWIYLEQGRWQLAEPLLKKNLEISRTLSATPGFRYANALANWGRVLEQKGDFAGAGAAFTQAITILGNDGRGESYASAKIEMYQSMLALDLHHLPDAIKLASESVALERKLGGDKSPQLATSLLSLGMAQLLSHDASAAEASFRTALTIRQQAYPAGHTELLLAQVGLAEALLAQHRNQDAADLMKTTVAAAHAAPFPIPVWRTAELNCVYALALRGLRQTKQADELFAANAKDLHGYNQAAVRDYLLGQIATARAAN